MTRTDAARIGAALLGCAIGIAQVGTATPAAAYDLPSQVEVGRTFVATQGIPLTIPSGVEPRSVYLGSYIVNVTGGCNGCHSNNEYQPGGNPFFGTLKSPVAPKLNLSCYLNGGQAFGPFVSRDITPVGGMPAGLTLAQFARVLRTGWDPEDPKGGLLQVMPWDGYQFMTGRDIKAVYDYLSSIPSLPAGGTSPC